MLYIGGYSDGEVLRMLRRALVELGPGGDLERCSNEDRTFLIEQFEAVLVGAGQFFEHAPRLKLRGIRSGWRSRFDFWFGLILLD